jgi:hypothetical protein
MLLKETGKVEQANRIFSEIIQAYDIMPRHARRLQREWFDAAKRGLVK